VENENFSSVTASVILLSDGKCSISATTHGDSDKPLYPVALHDATVKTGAKLSSNKDIIMLAIKNIRVNINVMIEGDVKRR
jgi:hypothetical protein